MSEVEVFLWKLLSATKLKIAIKWPGSSALRGPACTRDFRWPSRLTSGLAPGYFEKIKWFNPVASITSRLSIIFLLPNGLSNNNETSHFAGILTLKKMHPHFYSQKHSWSLFQIRTYDVSSENVTKSAASKTYIQYTYIHTQISGKMSLGYLYSWSLDM